MNARFLRVDAAFAAPEGKTAYGKADAPGSVSRARAGAYFRGTAAPTRSCTELR